MRGRNSSTLRSLDFISPVLMTIFDFEINCQQKIYSSKKIGFKTGFVIINKSLPDSYWNYAVIDDVLCIKNIEDIFNNFEINPSLYKLSKVKLDTSINEGYIKDYQDAWMILNSFTGRINKNVKIDEIGSRKEFINIYKVGRRNTGINPYEFSAYDLLLIYRQFAYSGKFKIKHFGAYMSEKLVGIATSITKDSITSICDVTVLKEFRGIGVGQSIIGGIIRSIPSNNIVYLVTEYDTHTEKWYERQGFETKFLGCCYTKRLDGKQ
jgi:hypothetical protein